MSRKQFKRQRKLQASKENWKRKAAEKKEKLRLLRQKAVDDPSSLTPEEQASLQRYQLKRQRVSEKKKLDVQPQEDAPTILIDMSFDDKMADRERASMAIQLRECHGMNRCARPVHLVFSGVEQSTEDALLAQDASNWKNIRIEKEHYLTRYDKERVSYLSSEGEKSLDELDPNRVYIIGGLVDHNREKGLTHRLATEAGVETLRLPIGEFLEMDSRKVLAVNHVFQILLSKYHGKTWQEAFLEAIPQRKGASTKTDN